MPFDPDAYLAQPPAAFDPDAYLAQTASPPSTLESLARGAAPYVGGMGAGALVGAGIGGLVGGPPGALAGAALGARAAPTALAIQDVGTQLYNVLANRFGGPQAQPLSAGLADVAGAVGIGRAGGSPLAEAFGAGAGGAGTLALGLTRAAPTYLPVVKEAVVNAMQDPRVLGGALRFDAPIRANVVNTMAQQPLAQSVAGGAGAATASQLQQSGVENPIALTLGSMAGGLAATSPATLGAINLATRGTNALVNRYGARIDPAEAYRADLVGGQGPRVIEQLRATPMSETGVPLTTAQASVGAEVPAYTAAMARVAEEFPDVAAQNYALLASQRASRQGAIEQFGATPQEIAALVARRTEITKPMYQESKSAASVADITPAYSTVQSLMQANPGNRPLMKELRAINRNLFETNEAGEAVLRSNAQQVSSIIDDLKSSINKQDNKYIKGQLSQVRDDLIAGVPGYREAQSAFRTASVPLNQRRFMNFMAEKLASLTSDATERAGVFGTAMKAMQSEKDAPAFLRRAIDNAPRYQTPEELLSPDMLRNLDAVRIDLARDDKLKSLVSAGRRSAGDPTKLATGAGLGEGTPPTLDRFMAILNRIIKKNAGRVDENLARELALESQNPMLAAANLERSLARQAEMQKFKLPLLRPIQPGAFATSQIPTVVNIMSGQNENAMAR